MGGNIVLVGECEGVYLVAEAGVGGGVVLVREWEGVDLVTDSEADVADDCFCRLRRVFDERAVRVDLAASLVAELDVADDVFCRLWR